MSKKLILLLDGTSNEIKKDRSNIVRLYGCLKRDDEQMVFYDPGVGTMGPDSWLRWSTKAYETWGLATGYGLDDNVRDAYLFLVENWKQGDEIFIFGFSRGAYTARVLAGFIRTIGLLQPLQSNLLDYTYRAYKRVSDMGGFENEVRLYEKMLKAERPPIRFLGLFDTVASMIVVKKALPSLESLPFTRNNHMVQSVRHAVAIDEQRHMFQPQLWEPNQKYSTSPVIRQDRREDLKDQDLEEVWFTGCHSDVGGGNPEGVSGLAKIPLIWMIDEATKCGLKFTTRTVNAIVKAHNSAGPVEGYEPPDPHAAINQSMHIGWKIAEIVPRRKTETTSKNTLLGNWYLPLIDHRKIPDGAKVHHSVRERMEKSGKRPVNLPTEVNWV